MHIASPDGIAVKKAIDIIKGLTTEPEVGEFYMGVVKRIAEFGAFVEILPGTDGLVHISELDEKRVRTVEDICKEGDEMMVKVIGIDRATGKIRLSRKEALGQDAGRGPQLPHRGRVVLGTAGDPGRSCPFPAAAARRAGAPLHVCGCRRAGSRVGRRRSRSRLLPGRGLPCRPGWRSRSRLASRGRCARARAWRARPASRCPTRRGPSTATIAARCMVLLVNLGAEPHVVAPGDRIAQLVIAPVVIAELEEVAELADSVRGAGGFGHTGQ